MQYKFLIYFSYSYALPIGIPIEEEILKRGYQVQWFSDMEDGKEAISHKSNVIQTIHQLVDYKPDIVLTATDDVPDFISGLKVQIFHGFFAQKRPGKNNKFAHFRIRGFFDLYCTQGPSTTTIFKKLQMQKKHFDVIETGWSKMDPLFPTTTKKISDIPTILIASTFTKRLSLAYDNAVYDTIKQLSASGQYKFLMVLHPKIPSEIVKKWKGLSGPNFIYHDTTYLIPLFKISDILFADTTSAIQEFLMQNKPVVTYNHTLQHDYLIQVNNVESIENAFKKALTYPKDLLLKIQDFINDLHPYFDGKSSERIIDTTINYLKHKKKPQKRKPTNLIRKYKIRMRLNYFTFRTF